MLVRFLRRGAWRFRTTAIPAVTHQTAATRDLTADETHFRDKVIALNPGWEHRFYTDHDCREIVRRGFPGLLRTYDAYPTAIQRTDLFRVAAVYLYGGVYLDLDVECAAPLATLLGRRCVLAEEKTLSAAEAEALGHAQRLRIANYMFASAPGHPFWLDILAAMVARASRPVRSDHDIVESTGPGLFSTIFAEAGGAYRDIEVLAHPGLTCPSCAGASCHFGAFARHWHRGSWKGRFAPAEAGSF